MSKNNKVKPVVARTTNQKRFLQAVNSKDFIFVDGVAGTGKTYLTVGICCDYLMRGKVEKIVFSRSSSHLTRIMGYSTGSWREKNLVFFDQITEYLHSFLGEQTYKKLWAENKIELTSTEIIRGRNFENSIIILEEAEMSPPEDFILFLSRLDKNSKSIFIGDRYQNGASTGFWAQLIDNLEDENIEIIMFDENDVQRHPKMIQICKKISSIAKRKK